MVNMLASAAVTQRGSAASLRARGIGSNIAPNLIGARVDSAHIAFRARVGATNDPNPRPGPLEEVAV